MLLTIGDLVEELVVELPGGMRRGRLAEARALRVRGGSAANVAAITCERGGAARFVGQVGADAMGDSLVEDLRQRGVDTQVSAHGVTGVTLNLLQDGYRTTLVDRGAAPKLTATDPSALAGVTQLFVPARSLMADPLATVVEDIVDAAMKRRVPITVTGLAADEVVHYGADAFLELVATLKPDAVISAARDHARLGLNVETPVEGSGSTIVTAPDRTAVLTSDGVRYRRATPPVTVADRTGAQDGFVAGYLMSRRAGATPVAAIDAAHRVAALVMARLGPTTRGGPIEA